MRREGLVIEEDVQIGEDLDTGYNVILRRGCKIGNDVRIWSNTVIDPGAVIGDLVHIHCGCYVAQNCVVEDGVFMAPGVQLLNDKYPPRYDPYDWEPVIVRSFASIGAGAQILPGVVIGERARIGAGAVVTKDVPADQTWVGNPARELTWLT